MLTLTKLDTTTFSPAARQDTQRPTWQPPFTFFQFSSPPKPKPPRHVTWKYNICLVTCTDEEGKKIISKIQPLATPPKMLHVCVCICLCVCVCVCVREREDSPRKPLGALLTTSLLGVESACRPPRMGVAGADPRLSDPQAFS